MTYSLFDQSVTGYNTTEPTNLTTISSPFAGPATTQLAANSPAINTGSTQAYTNAGGPPTDLARNPRLVGTSCAIDMGAYEVQVGTPVSILVLQQPVSGSSVCVGSNVTASVSVTGTVTNYAWYKDGQLLNPPQNTSALSLTNVSSTDQGSYSVVVTGACNSATSTAFNLTVIAASPSGAILSLSTLQDSCPVRLVGRATGTSFVFTGPGGYVFSQVYRQAGTYDVFGLDVKASGQYMLTVINTSGCGISTPISQTVIVNRSCP